MRHAHVAPGDQILQGWELDERLDVRGTFQEAEAFVVEHQPGWTWDTVLTSQQSAA